MLDLAAGPPRAQRPARATVEYPARVRRLRLVPWRPSVYSVSLRRVVGLGLSLASACSAPSGGGEQLRDVGNDAVEIGFFVTSRGAGNGGDLGGLAGADAHCSELADRAGLPLQTWRAFLSASGPIHARDRVGSGPWRNAAGVVVAEDLEQLLADGVASDAMLDELGEPAATSPPPGREHDILTGSDEAGRLLDGRTCEDWTSNASSDRVSVGHHDWELLPSDQWTQSWTNVHRSSCDAEGMARQLGSARTYCFAAD